MRTQKRPRIKFIHFFVIFLAGLGGFFIVKNLGKAPQLRTQAQTGVERSSSLQSNSPEELTILSRLRSILSQLKGEPDPTNTGAEVLTIVRVLGGVSLKSFHVSQASSRSTVQTIKESSPSAPSIPSTTNNFLENTHSNTSKGGSSAIQSATLSPFVLPATSARIAIAGVAQLVIENFSVNAFVDSAQQVFISIETQARNRGTVSSLNTPFKIFMTDSGGNSILLGEQLIPSLAPNASASKKVSFQCPKSGAAEVCVTVPAQLGIASNGGSETRVCKTVVVPEGSPTSSTSTTSNTGLTSSTSTTTPASSNGTNSTSASTPSDATCLCNRK